MDAHTKVAGSWKKLNGIHVKVSGAWKEVTDAYVKVGGVWKQFYQNLALSGGALGTSFHSNASTVSTGFRFNRNGTIDKLSNGTWSIGVANWMTGGSVPTDIGDDYEIEVSFSSGDTELQPATADGTYRDLNVTRTYRTDESPGGFYTATLTYTIREIADVSNSTSGSWICNTEDGS